MLINRQSSLDASLYGYDPDADNNTWSNLRYVGSTVGQLLDGILGLNSREFQILIINKWHKSCVTIRFVGVDRGSNLQVLKNPHYGLFSGTGCYNWSGFNR